MEIAKVVLSEQIKSRLIDDIVAGTYMSGDRLVESELSKRFNVSQSPVREALKGLEEMGLVTQEPYKGTTVRTISDKDFYEAFTVRAALESLAAGLAAAKCTDTDIAVLENMLSEMEACAEAQDEDNRIRVNNQFHDEIIRISGHSLIARLSKTLRFAGWSHFKGSRLCKEKSFYIVARHRSIIDALAAHDVSRAEEEMRRHIEENIPESEYESDS
jgi:DNA-binding GntR family transcriptional regulator